MQRISIACGAFAFFIIGNLARGLHFGGSNAGCILCEAGTGARGAASWRAADGRTRARRGARAPEDLRGEPLRLEVSQRPHGANVGTANHSPERRSARY